MLSLLQQIKSPRNFVWRLERICGADSILNSQKRILVDFTLLTNRKTMAALFKVDL